MCGWSGCVDISVNSSRTFLILKFISFVRSLSVWRTFYSSQTQELGGPKGIQRSETRTCTHTHTNWYQRTQTNKHTHRQTDRHTHTHIHTQTQTIGPMTSTSHAINILPPKNWWISDASWVFGWGKSDSVENLVHLVDLPKVSITIFFENKHTVFNLLFFRQTAPTLVGFQI